MDINDIPDAKIKESIAKKSAFIDAFFDPSLEGNYERPPKTEEDEKICLSYWFPLLQTTGVPVPKTSFLRTDVDLIHLVDMNIPEGCEEFIEKLASLAGEMGTPCFLRTGMTSGKHNWENSCYLPDCKINTLKYRVCDLVNFSCMANMMGPPLPMDVWVIREFLDLENSFTAFGSGLPISKERRYFIRDGEVEEHFPYWPESAIYGADKENWKELLAEISVEDEDEVRDLSAMAKTVSEKIEGYWSLDFAKGTDGVWYAIGPCL